MVSSFFLRKFKKKVFRVVIFGSARVKKNDKVYKQVYELAKNIGQIGADVVTGGGPGLMAAASEGHEAGTPNNEYKTIGLNIHLPFEQKANKHLDMVEDFDQFSDRLNTFMGISNLLVVAEGGIGTMLEFYFAWQLMQVGHIWRMPIVLIGDMWKQHLRWVKKNQLKRNLISEKDLEYIFIVKNVKQAVKIVKKAHIAYLKDGPEACVDWKKY